MFVCGSGKRLYFCTRFRERKRREIDRMKAGVAGKRVLRKRKLTEGAGMIPDAGKGSRKETSGEISDDMLEALAFAAAWRGKRRRPRKKTPEKFGGYAENPLSLQPVSPERVKKRSMVRLHKQQEVVQEQELS